MRPGKLIALVVIGAVGWQHQEALGRHVSLVRDAGPLVMTYTEMRQYRTALISEMNRNRGQPPRNTSAWLERTFNRGTRKASEDLWGTRYRVERGESRRWYLRSCGPDKQCRSEDDLVAPLFVGT